MKVYHVVKEYLVPKGKVLKAHYGELAIGDRDDCPLRGAYVGGSQSYGHDGARVGAGFDWRLHSIHGQGYGRAFGRGDGRSRARQP